MPALQEATGHFSEKYKLGQGGSGTVYKVSSRGKRQGKDTVVCPHIL